MFEKNKNKKLIFGKIFAIVVFIFTFFPVGKFFSEKVQASEQPEAKPISEEFENWKESQNDSSVKKLKSSVLSHDHATGLVPDPFRKNNRSLSAESESADVLAMKIEAEKEEASKLGFPAVYDLRSLGSVSSVKNQGTCGSCWVFATAGSLESNWLTLGESEKNISENNMKECHRFDWSPCEGGNSSMATSYLSLNQGPVLETSDPYSEEEENSCVSSLTPLNYVYEAHYLPNTMSVIKQAITDHGALFTSLYMNESSSYYNSSNYTYYYYGSANPNHAVTLAGWDDTKVTAGGTGAWIIKNSWDSSWGDNGYFYVSYNDTKINSEVTVWTKKEDYTTDKKIYAYDEIGAVGGVGYSDGTDYSATKFTATGNQKITRIASWIPDNGATVSFWIYSGFDGTNFSGLLGSLVDQTATYAGYYTFDLASPVSISGGSDFYVKAKFDIPSTNYPIPAEYAEDGYMTPSIQSGKNWVSNNGTSWLSIGSGTGYDYDLGVRVYAEGNTGTSPIYRFQNKTNGTYLFTGQTEKDSVIVNYSQTFTLEGLAFYVPASGIPIYRFQNKNNGTYLFTGEEEKNSVLENYSQTFTLEGLAFYVPASGIPIYRFQNKNNGTYLFTGEEEKNSVLENYSQTFTLEGLAFYASN